MAKPSPDEDRLGVDRRLDLRRYLIKCVAQNIITKDELWKAPMSVLARLGATLLSDIAAIGRAARDDLGEAASETAGNMFFQMARSIAERKR